MAGKGVSNKSICRMEGREWDKSRGGRKRSVIRAEDGRIGVINGQRRKEEE